MRQKNVIMLPPDSAPSGQTFLFEMGCEDIPAENQKKAPANLEAWWKKNLPPYVLYQEIRGFITPRRMAIMLSDLSLRQGVEEKKGPLVSLGDAAFQGFCRTLKVQPQNCRQEIGPKGPFWAATVSFQSYDIREVLRAISMHFLQSFPWSNMMRWPQSSYSWIRPVRTLTCLLDGVVLPWSWENLVAQGHSYGHRLLSAMKPEQEHSHRNNMNTPEEPLGTFWPKIPLDEARNYEQCLKQGYVLVDQDARKAVIRAALNKSARDLNAQPCGAVEALIEENAALTQWPVAILGHFDEKFLALPAPVIMSALEIHQKCFCFSLNVQHGAESREYEGAPCNQGADESKLKNAFLAISDGKALGDQDRYGYESVVQARLEDALFFWQSDKKRSLESLVQDLAHRDFFQGLGTLYDKVQRLESLGGALTCILPDAQKNTQGAALLSRISRALSLFKADIASTMVQEFPQLHGIMGCYYALAAGMDASVAHSLKLVPHFYAENLALVQVDKETFALKHAGGESWPLVIGASVALFDSLDSLLGFLALGRRPSSSKDPLGLRRMGNALIKACLCANIYLDIGAVAVQILLAYQRQRALTSLDQESVVGALKSFLCERLESLLLGHYPGAHESVKLAAYWHVPKNFPACSLWAYWLPAHRAAWFSWLEVMKGDHLGLRFLYACKRVSTLLLSLREPSLSVSSDDREKDMKMHEELGELNEKNLRARLNTPQEQDILNLLEKQNHVFDAVVGGILGSCGALSNAPKQSPEGGAPVALIFPDSRLYVMYEKAQWAPWVTLLEDFFQEIHMQDTEKKPWRMGLLHRLERFLQQWWGPLTHSV